MCMSMGGFNNISSHHEKEGGIRKPQNLIDTFNSMIEDINMEDLGAKGQNFTWSNNRRGGERVNERLDRVLINSRWEVNYPNATCINELAIGSNHTPMVLLMKEELKRRKIMFRFEKMWMENLECEPVIRSAWNKRTMNQLDMNVEPKLSCCRKRLIRWSIQKFGNNITKLRKANEKLKALSRQTMCDRIQRGEEELKDQIKELWI